MGNFLHVARNAGRDRPKQPGEDGKAEKFPSPGLEGRSEFGPVVDTSDSIC
jgi:hypothetical protein